MKNTILLFLSLIATLQLCGQGYALIITDVDCQVTIDGETTENLAANTPKKITLIAGEHILQAKSDEKEVTQIIKIEEGKQKVVKVLLLKNIEEATEAVEQTEMTEEPFIMVADLNLSLAGEVNALAEDDFSFDNASDLNFAFAAGDIVALNGDILNKKGQFFIQILAYPEMTPIYSKEKLENLQDHQITIQNEGIYIIRIGTSAFLDKKIHLEIKRKPNSAATRDFNTQVVKKYRYETVKMLEPEAYYVNNTLNESFKNGKSKITIPISTPPNTIEWYYTISASRNKEEIKKNLETTSLLEDLAKAVINSNPTTAAVNIALNLLTKPPGADYCDVYLLDAENRSLYVNNLACSYIIEGSRENVKSAVVKVKGGLNEEHYIGLENKDNVHGIHLTFEAAAVVQEVYLDYMK